MTSGCVLVLGGGGGGGGACWEGTWHLSGQQIASAIESLFGDLDVTEDPSGLTLELDGDDNTWRLYGAQTLGVEGNTPWGFVDGQVDALVNVTGTFQGQGGGNFTFNVTSIGDAATFNGTLNGNPLSTNLTLEQVGLDDIYGWTGSASYTCGTGSLAIDFPAVHWQF